MTKIATELMDRPNLTIEFIKHYIENRQIL